MQGVRWTIAAAAVVWAAALPLAALAAGEPRQWAVQYPLALTVYGIGSFVCHQRPERSFHIAGVALPVCARCAGIYAGGAVWAVFSHGAAARRSLQLSSRRAAWWFLAVAAAPACLTLAYEWTTGIAPSNSVRAASGLLLGAAVVELAFWSHPQDEARPLFDRLRGRARSHQ